MSRVDVLGVGLDGVTMQEALARVEEAISKQLSFHVVTLNAEILYRALADERLKGIIQDASLVTPDGTGVVWASKVLGSPVPERVAGVDLTERLLQKASAYGWRVFFYGAHPEVLSLATERLSLRFPGLKVVGAVDGYIDAQEEDLLVEKIGLAAPDLLLVALGAPLQEFFISRYLQDLPPLVAVGVGGSFDVFSGRVRRAPGWVQGLRLEWLYRAGFSRARWKRLTVLPRFVFRVLAQRFRGS